MLGARGWKKERIEESAKEKGKVEVEGEERSEGDEAEQKGEKEVNNG